MPRWALLFLLAAGLPAQGSPVHVTATGFLYNYDDPQGLLPFGGTFGTPVTLELVYDSAATDAAPSNSTIGVYEAVLGMTLTVGETVVPAFPSMRIGVINDQVDPVATLDVWEARSQVDDGPRSTQFYLWFLNLCVCPGPTDLDSDALVPPPWPGTWDAAGITYSVREGTDPLEPATLAIAEAEVTSVTVVPLPSAAWLFTTGALAAAAWARRRQFSTISSVSI